MNRQTESIPVLVFGGSGYVAGEVLRLLAGHPVFRVVRVFSTSQADVALPAVFPHLAGSGLDGLRFTPQEALPESLAALAGEAGSGFGTGGMQTKLQAARIAMNSGVSMVIANGATKNILGDILAGEACGTFFGGFKDPRRRRKCWLAWSTVPKGKLQVDEGAARALVDQGKSLLPIGITQVNGNFDVGAVVSVVGHDGVELARGIVNYPSKELRKISGKKTGEIAGILGYKDYDEVIHRDNLLLDVAL